jgi:hypothetical protein
LGYLAIDLRDLDPTHRAYCSEQSAHSLSAMFTPTPTRRDSFLDVEHGDLQVLNSPVGPDAALGRGHPHAQLMRQESPL